MKQFTDDGAEYLLYKLIWSIRMFITIFILIFVAAPLYSTDDSSEESNAHIVTLKLPRTFLPPRNVSDISARANLKVIDAFLTKYPTIRLIPATGLYLRGMGGSSLLMSIAGGIGPDIIPASFKSTRTYSSEGFLLPLDDLLKKTPKVSEGIANVIWPVIRHPGPPDGKIHTYYIPVSDLNVMGLMYRKDLFAKAGLDPEKPPVTWKEFYKYAKIITNPDKGIYGFATYRVEGEGWIFTNFIYQAGGRLVEEIKPGVWKASYNSPAGLTALKFYRKLIIAPFEKDGVTIKGVVLRGSGAEMFNGFADGKVAMIIDNMNGDLAVPRKAQEDPDMIGFAPLPYLEGHTPASLLNCTVAGISSAVKDPKVKDAAWKFLTFLRSDKARYIRTKFFVENGYGNFINPVTLKHFGYKKLAATINPEYAKIQEEAIASGVPEPYGPKCSAVYGELGNVIDKALKNPGLNLQATLDKGARHTDEILLGYIPPKVMAKRRKIVWCFILVTSLIMIVSFIRIIKIFSSMESESVSIKNRPGTHILAWTFMSAALLSVLVWGYYPVLRGLLMAFQDYHIILPKPFIGVDNFVEVLWQPKFWMAVKNTIVYVALTLSLGFFAPMLLALVLNEIPKGSLLFRIIFYLPAITSPLVVMMLWTRFYNGTKLGLFNQLLMTVGLNPIHWLDGNPLVALICVIIPGIWGGLGVTAIFYLAALKNVPDELYESASLDGAGIILKLRHITFPILKILVIINFVGAFIGAFHASERILVMTGGGPDGGTYVLGLSIFKNAFIYLKFGYATAVAWILGTALVGFTIYQLKIISKAKFTGGR